MTETVEHAGSGTRTPAALPDDVVLFHAGFHKTGTTALQSAFASHREEIAAAGTRYPGQRRSHHRAAMAVTRRSWGWSDRGGDRVDRRYWSQVVRGAAEPGRVFISSEAFALADEGSMDRILRELPRERVHAIFTLRPFARLLGSSWQQYLKYGLSAPYEDWLRAVFKNPPKCPPSPNFWRRNDHAGIIGRWADRLGPENVTAVVLDESDRTMLFRTFERLLALPEGILVPDAALAASNRSMTAAEAETLRLVNAEIAKRWDWPQYSKLVRRGAILRMVEGRTPARDEVSVGTPAWAVAKAQEFGAWTAERLGGSGVTVIGDLDSLSNPIRPAPPPGPELSLPVEAAAEAILGAIAGGMAGRATLPASDAEINKLALPAVQLLSTREAADVLRDRMRTARQWRMQKVKRSVRRMRPGS
jgi:hypothetical protein